MCAISTPRCVSTARAWASRKRVGSKIRKASTPWFSCPRRTVEAEIELTYNWGSTEDYGSARNFGHLAFRVEDIYATCQRLMDMGYTIHRPPRDGHMAFVRSPDLISVELLQDGHLPPREPWASMPNTGQW